MNSPALARLLDHAADTVAGVRGGRSLTDLLPRVPEVMRPGVQALAFHALRRLGGAQEVRARLAPKTPPPAVDALLLTALALLWPEGPGAAGQPAEPPPYAEHTLVDQAVAAARQRTPAAAAFVNAVLRRFLRERDACVEAARHTPLGEYNHPAWWIERLRQDWPRHWAALLHEANRRPPMTLRVNARRGSARAYIERLAQHGIVAHLLPPPAGWPAGLDSHAVQLAEPRAVTQLPGFADGEASVQDAAAQLAAPLLIGGGAAAREGAAPLPRLPAGARVLDACAAPGGKTAHLLELADLDLLALDVDAQRLARVQANLKRLKLPAAGGAAGAPGASVRVAAGDARRPAEWWDGRPFDAILLDAPCTASGIVRRHPDVRWLRRPADIDALAQVQAQLLAALWPLLAPGGRLLYATCSIFKAEGERQIDAFLQRLGPAAARLRPESPGHLLPLADNDPAREPGASAMSHPSQKGATSDGFFYALIEKT
ncbi:MAG: 16S rRNA (cytosine(967)-C(5))-methyltransferase RsmB [Burkholderiales bacterium]|nr:16S rRNA (cytosine(967)-C(5))-methyltransferase RsmB [Burkholderiales bacterium]